MMSRMWSKALAASAIAAMVLLPTGCAHEEHKEAKSVDPSLTEEAARQRIFGYLEKTADETGIGFSMSPDGDNHGSPFQPAGPMPCYDGYQEHGPHQVQVSYWVVGVPAGQTPQYFARLRQTWTGWGWKLDSEATSTLAGLGTPDNYTFVLQDAGKGDGWLSITAASPCFPYSGMGSKTPQPTVIQRPS